MRKKIVAGNWKMNKNLEEGLSLSSEIIHIAADELRNDAKIVIIPPFIHLYAVSKLMQGNQKISLGAQNCAYKEEGAYTGEVSAKMLASLPVQYCIVGHSERREYFKESNAELAEKVNLLLAEGITPIFCCGETSAQRAQGIQLDWVCGQLKESLFHLDSDNFAKIIIAYEPLWAIGTGVTASTEEAQEMHEGIRNFITARYGETVAQSISILYGGSVKPENAKELFACKDIDGGLIGGASLKARGFIDIIKAF